MIYHLLNSFEIGGTERQSTELIMRLRKLGLNISVGTLNKRGPLLESFRDEAIEEYSLRRFLDPMTIKKVFNLSQELQTKSITILHCHDFYTNVFGTIAGRISRVPIIINSRRDMGDLVRPSQQKLQRTIAKGATHIVVNAKAIRDKLLRAERIPKEKITVIYNGFDVPDSTYAGPQKGGNGAFRVGMIANFGLPAKGHSYFLQAAALVLKEIPKAEFYLAGDGPLRQDAQNRACQLGIEGRTHFVGRVDPTQTLKELDLLVNPSLSEGLSNSLIEAMGYGIPVIATGVGGSAELIDSGKRGLLVDEGSPRCIASAVVWMFDHPSEASRMAMAAREFIQENLSWETTCGKYRSLYESLLARIQK
jgi:glycosyltransferase involved in cell wall biosynthesis